MLWKSIVSVFGLRNQSAPWDIWKTPSFHLPSHSLGDDTMRPDMIVLCLLQRPPGMSGAQELTCYVVVSVNLSVRNPKRAEQGTKIWDINYPCHCSGQQISSWMIISFFKEQLWKGARQGFCILHRTHQGSNKEFELNRLFWIGNKVNKTNDSEAFERRGLGGASRLFWISSH